MQSHTFKIDLVVADRNWILEEFASHIERLAPGEGVSYRVVDSPSPDADLCYFLPYSVFKPVPGAICGALFTHIEEDVPQAKQRFFDVAREADFCVCMSDRYEKRLRDEGITNVRTILPGVDRTRFQPKLRLGIVGRAYHTGRKNEAMVARLRALPFVDIVYTGSGWPGRSVYYSDAALNEFYNSIDYLLLPGKIEGGPMPLLEALAAGTQVIAPDVGFVDRFPHIPYENSNLDSLLDTLRRLYDERCALHASLDGITWDAFAAAHDALFRELLPETAPGRTADDGPAALHATLVTHGSESTTRGGPTQRVRYTADLLAPLGIAVTHHDGAGADLSDVVHVFNTWPLKSARQTVATYRQAGVPVVLSPILLDLAFLPEYRAMASCDSRTEVRERLHKHSQALQAYRSGTRRLLETVQDHFSLVVESCLLSDQVIALSGRERQQLEALGVPRERISLVHNCVDPAFLDGEPDPQAFRALIGHDRFFLSVGRVESRKNLLAICEALYDTGVPIVSIGASPEPEYRSAIELLYGDRVVFLDRVDDRPLLASAYAACTAFVQLSWAEGASLAALEAHACGARMIVAPTSGEEEYFDADDVDFVPAFDLDAVAAAGRAAIADTATAQSRRARRLTGVRAAVARYASDTASAYRAAIARRRQRCSDIVYVDITSYAHAVHNGQTSTGGLMLERKLMQAYLDRTTPVKFLVWSHVVNGFHVLDRDHVRDEDLVDTLRGTPPQRSDVTYFRKGLPAQLAPTSAVAGSAAYDAHVTLLLDKLDHATLLNAGGRYLAFQLLKSGVRSLPGVLRAPLVGLIRKLRPSFDLGSSLPTGVAPVAPVPRAAERAPGDDGMLQAATLATTPILDGAVLVNIGNAWLSNPRYLDTLQTLVGVHRLDLRAIVYDLLPITHRQYFPPASSSKFESHLRILGGIASELHAISDYTLDALSTFLRLNRLSARTRVMGLGSTRIAGDPKPVDGLPERYVLFVSSINQRKNHRFLLQVWAELQARRAPQMQDVTLVLVGKNTFKDMELASVDNVLHLSDVDDERLLSIYNGCLFTVYPSVAEGFGLPVIESLEYGKPCIASDLASLAEFNHPALLKIAPDDFYGWLDAILTLACNTSIREALSAECEGFEVEHTWAQAAAGLAARDGEIAPDHAAPDTAIIRTVAQETSP